MLKSNINSVQFINPSFSPKISVAFVINTFTNWSLFKILEIWEFSTKLLPLPGPSELLMANKQVTSLPKQLAKLDIKWPSWGFKDLIPNSSLWIRLFTESKNATHLTGPSYSFTIFLQQIRNHMKSWVSFHTIMEPLHDISPTMPEKVRLKQPDDFYARRPSSPSCHPQGYPRLQVSFETPAEGGRWRSDILSIWQIWDDFGGFTHREIIHGLQEGAGKTTPLQCI